MILNFSYSILDTSRNRLTIDISEIFPEKKEINFFYISPTFQIKNEVHIVETRNLVN